MSLIIIDTLSIMQIPPTDNTYNIIYYGAEKLNKFVKGKRKKRDFKRQNKNAIKNVY